MYVPSEDFLSSKTFFLHQKKSLPLSICFSQGRTPAPASANYFLFSWERLAQRIFNLRVYYIILYENIIHPFVSKQKFIFVLLAKNRAYPAKFQPNHAALNRHQSGKNTRTSKLFSFAISNVPPALSTE